MQCGYRRYTLVGHAVVSVVNGEVARTFALCVCVCVCVSVCARACLFVHGSMDEYLNCGFISVCRWVGPD